WSSDVCSSDLGNPAARQDQAPTAPDYRLLRLLAVGRDGWRARTWACAQLPRLFQARGHSGGSATPPQVPSATDERYLRHRSSASAKRNAPRRVALAGVGIATCPDSSLR